VGSPTTKLNTGNYNTARNIHSTKDAHFLKIGPTELKSNIDDVEN